MSKAIQASGVDEHSLVKIHNYAIEKHRDYQFENAQMKDMLYVESTIMYQPLYYCL